MNYNDKIAKLEDSLIISNNACKHRGEIINKMIDLLELYDEYTTLLSDEIEELASTASVRGWKSKRTEHGAALREKISLTKLELNGGK